METPDAVLAYWFGDSDDDAEVARVKGPLWFGGGSAVDDEIRRRFASLRDAAIAGRLDDWQRTPRDRLALIVLVDQFSRNLQRGDARAFAHDALAQHWCLDGLARGDDRALRPIERVFFYLPLEHAESREHQQRSVALYAQLAAEAPSAQRALFENYLDYARRHRDIVERFGRFPHRNAVLGRASTVEEAAFLQQPGSGF